jgi:Rrf2 family protein
VIFTASATHALRALSLLAARDPEEAILGRDLAREVDVPAAYLSKVLAALARTGVLRATRGAGGGYRLARSARKIRLIEVVEPFEGQRAVPGCLLRPDQPCTDQHACGAHRKWSRAQREYVRFLERTTLADIAEKT